MKSIFLREDPSSSIEKKSLRNVNMSITTDSDLLPHYVVAKTLQVLSVEL